MQEWSDWKFIQNLIEEPSFIEEAKFMKETTKTGNTCRKNLVVWNVHAMHGNDDSYFIMSTYPSWLIVGKKNFITN